MFARRLAVCLSAVFCVFLSLPCSAPGQDKETTPQQKESAQQAQEKPYDPLAHIPDRVTQHYYPGYTEDLKNLSVKGSVMPPETPVLGQPVVDSEGGFTTQLIQLSWRPHDALDLYVTKPLKTGRPHPIILLYSGGEKMDRFKSRRFGLAMAPLGFAVVGMGYAKSDYRIEYGPPAENYITVFDQALAWTVHDIQKVIDYLESRGDLDTSQIAVFGEGAGGTAAILASTVDPRITVLEVLNPWGSWPDWFAKSQELRPEERADFLKPEYLKSVEYLDPAKRFPEVKAKHARMVNVKDNAFVPDASQLAIQKAAPNTVEIHDFGDSPAFLHMFGGPRLFDWVYQHLNSGVSATAFTSERDRVHVYPRAVEPIH